MPLLSSADAATQASQDLIQALKHPHLATPFATLGNAQHYAIEQLAQMFADALPNKRDKNGILKNASEHATSVRDESRTRKNASEQDKPTELDRIAGTAASTEGVSATSEGGSTHYQMKYQMLYGGRFANPSPHIAIQHTHKPAQT
jgi:hypothetical protein